MRSMLGTTRGRLVGWLLLLLSTGTLLTNAYYLRFAEPALSRKTLAALLLVATALFFLARRYGLPHSKEELWSLLGRARTPLILGAILVLAAMLRYPGLSSGLPQSYIPDEYDYVHSYLQMIKRGDMNPHWWHHPSVQPYVNVVTYLAVFYLEAGKGRWQSIHQMQVEDMLFWGRFGAGFVPGMLTVIAVFFLGRYAFSERVGLIAAALTAVVPGLVEISQYNKPDALLVLFCTVSVLVTLYYLDRGGRTLAFAAGVVVGLTVAVKYNGALVLLPFVAAVSFRHGVRALTRPDLYLGGLGAIVGFVVGCPYFFADLARFLDHVGHGLYAYGFQGLRGAEGVDNWFTHASYTVRYGAGLVPFLASLLGLAIALYRIDRRIAVFLLYPVLYYSFYSSQRVIFAGNLMPVYPFFAILAGLGLTETVAFLTGRVPRRAGALRPVVLVAAVLAMLAFPLSMSRLRDRLITLPDTGSIAAQWIEAHFPPRTHFGVERHTPVLDRNRFRITEHARVIDVGVQHYREAGVQYLIVTSTAYERFGPESRQTKNYQKLFNICPTVKEFAPIEGKIMGPTIRILQIPGATG
jgi:4-amino-4-deoxy-L-arabinose transferase-like glycosyltransferase